MHRLSLLGNQFEPAVVSQQASPAPPKKDSLSVVDNRTGMGKDAINI